MRYLKALFIVLIIGLLAPLAAWTFGVISQYEVHKKAEEEQVNKMISWVFEVTIKPGEMEKLEALIKEMSDQADANEPGTLQYEWMISDDGTRGQVHERYSDSGAALNHLASFNENYAERLMTMVDPKGMTVYGDPSTALKKKLAGVEPVYMHPAGGFTRE